MNVGLLTIHDSVNPGASLQACGLYQAVKDLGHEVSVINYCPNYFPSHTNVIKPLLAQGPKGIAKAALLGKRLKAKAALFQEFADSTYSVGTRRYANYASLKSAPPMFDAVICGSDQIWNPPHVCYDDAWFFSFYGSNRPRLISYAASIGKDRLDEKDLSWLVRGASTFDFVGVREDTGVDLLLGNGVDAVQCVDPTFLCSRDMWESLERRPSGDVPEKFIFYYPLQENPLEAELVRAVSDDFGLRVVSVWSALRKLPSMDIQIPVFGPREFLWLMNHSEAVVTNSFHGLAFSVIFEKNLVSFKNLTRNSRLASLLKILGVENYQISSMEEYRNTNWDERFRALHASKQRIAEEVSVSEDFLRRALL